MTALQPLPVFVLRGAGFPAADALLPGTGATRRAAQRLLSLRTRLDELHAALLDVLAGTPVPRAERHRLRRRLRARAPVEDGLCPAVAEPLVAHWNRAVTELAAAGAELAEAGAAELADAERYLRDWHARPLVGEAVWFSSHSAATGMSAFTAGRQRSATTRRVALRYLQRLATKNETTSFFGPFQYGPVAPGTATALLDYDPTSPRHGERCTLLARHVVDALAARIGAALATDPAVPLVAHPVAEVQQRGIRLADRQIALPAALTAALRAGPVVPAELPERARVLAAKLVGAGLLTAALAPPATSLAELTDLRAAVLGSGAAAGAAGREWLTRLDALDGALRTVHRSGWPARARACAELDTLLTGYGLDTGQRGAGALYADRQPVHQECEGGLRGLRLDQGALGRWAAPLTAVLRVHAAYAARVRDDTTRWVRDRWAGAGLPASATLYALLEQLHPDGQVPYREHSPSAAALWQRLDAVAPEGTRRVEIGSAQLLELFADALPDEPFVCSPDLMLRRRPGGAPEQLVVGEIHHGVQPWCWLARTLSETRREPIRAAVGRWARVLAGGAEPVTLVEPRYTGKTFTLEFPGLALELLARSALPRDQVLTLRDVVAHRDSMTLCSTAGVPLRLMPTSPVSPLVRAFGALPLWGPRTPPLHRHRPRVVVDGMVWLRESWRLGAAELAALTAVRTAHEATLGLARLRRDLGWPRFVYAKPDGEAKPVFADLESAAYCDMLAHLVAGRSSVLVSEMLPGPDELVLGCADGAFTSELRTSFLVGGRDDG